MSQQGLGHRRANPRYSGQAGGVGFLFLVLALVRNGKPVYLVLNGGYKGKKVPVHGNCNFPPICGYNGPGAVVVILHHAKQRNLGQRRACNSLAYSTHLPPAAVQQNQTGQHSKLASRPLFVFRRPAAQGLGHACVVIGACYGAYFKPAVSALEGLTVLKHHHAAYTGAVAPVGNVVAFNYAGRLGQAQHRRCFVQQALLLVHPAAFPGQPFHRIGIGHVYQLGRIPPLGNIKLHPAAPCLLQQLVQRLAVLRQFIHRNHLGNFLPIQIIPGQKFLPQLVQIPSIPEQKLPFIRQPALAVAQNGGTAAALGSRKGDYIHLGIFADDHLLACAHLLDGSNLVPQQSSLLKVQPFRRLLHPLFQLFDNILFAVADHPHSPLYGLLIALLTDASAAYSHTLANVGIQAWPPLANILGKAAVAPGQQKSILGSFHHLTHCKAAGVGANVLGAILLLLQHSGDAGIILFGNFHIAVPLIILQQNVVFGGMGLNLAGLQHQGLKLTLAHNDIKGKGVFNHLGYLCIMGHPFTEILAHPGAQPLGLANVDDNIPLIPNDIHTGQKRQHLCLLVQFCFCHGSSLLSRSANRRPAYCTSPKPGLPWRKAQG